MRIPGHTPHWIVREAYRLGVISSSRYTFSAKFTGYVKVRFRGRRPYILGIQRHRWRALSHRMRTGHCPGWLGPGLCGRCAPWPCCGATGWEHHDGCQGPDFT